MSCTKYTFAFAVIAPLLAIAGCASAPGHDSLDSTSPIDSSTVALAEKELALFQQGITSLNNVQLERAESDFKELSRSRPGLAGPWINLALIDVKKKNFDDAERNVAKALERNPRMPQAFNILGFVEVSRGNMNKAVEHYRKAISLKTDYAIAYYNMALLHDIYLHDIATAVQHYKRYLELTNHQDKKTSEWVTELERGLAKGPQ